MSRKTFRERGGPLAGIRVIELTKVWAGPCVGKLLSYLGAEVIRIESEKSMDVTRFYGVDDINNAPGFKSVNPEKLSVQIDVKAEKGIALIKQLLADADVFVENLRPGAVERLGLGYETVKAVNPAIIYTAMGMYGSDGPLAYQTGYAPCFAALGGLSAQVGYEGEAPAGMNVRYADSTFGSAAALAIAAALVHRQQTGEGQSIDVSAVETLSGMVGDSLVDYALNGRVKLADGNRHQDMAPHGVYPCADGQWLALAIRTDSEWQTLASQLPGDVESNPAYQQTEQRIAAAAELDSLITDWTRGQSVDALVEQLQAKGLAASKSLNSIDLIADAGLWGRGFFAPVTQHDGNDALVLGPGWRMTDGARIERGAPRLGEHNDYVFNELLGLDAGQRAALDAEGVTK